MTRLSCLLPLIIALHSTAVPAEPTEDKTDPREAAIQSVLRNYVEAFNKKDVETVTGAWGEEASYHDRATGERIEGGKAIRKDIAESIKSNPKTTLTASLERIKFLTGNVVQIAGQTMLSTPGEDPQVSQFSAILVKSGEKWQIQSLEESAVPQPTTAYDALKELDWLVGQWVEQQESTRVVSRVRWSSNGSFLIRSYALETSEGLEQEGTQVIGWDPRAKSIRSWTFNSDGSFGEGVWSKSADEWLIKSVQTLADGRAASGTYVLTQVDEESLQLQLIGHTIGGVPQPATDAVTMTRSQPKETAERLNDTQSTASEPKPEN